MSRELLSKQTESPISHPTLEKTGMLIINKFLIVFLRIRLRAKNHFNKKIFKATKQCLWSPVSPANLIRVIE